MTDMINHPPHYTGHPSGIQCIQITEHMGFLLGNAFKYVFRAGLKGDAAEDLGKARFYICRAMTRPLVSRPDAAQYTPLMDDILNHEPNLDRAVSLMALWAADVKGNHDGLILALASIDYEIARLAHV